MRAAKMGELILASGRRIVTLLNMKRERFPLWGGMGVVISLLFVLGAAAQDDAAWKAGVSEDLRGLNESVKRLTDRMDVLEAKCDELQKQVLKLQSDLRAMNASSPELAREIDRINTALKEMDAAREKERNALIEQVAKLLDEFKKRELSSPAPPPSDKTIKHTVQRGENLTVIAKAYGVKVSDIQKANGLTSDALQVGQVLLIPKKD